MAKHTINKIIGKKDLPEKKKKKLATHTLKS